MMNTSMDILDLDEVLKDDSFCNLSADRMAESVTDILQQWKQNEMTLMGTKGTKLVDTRTFTRPKRRISGVGESVGGDHQENAPMTPFGAAAAGGGGGINLQVGGIVTPFSMRRSLIGETSPPSSFCSSMDSMNDEMLNSLINSGDFNNVTSFLENLEDSQNINFNGYKLEDVIKDRQFLDNLTLSEDQTFSKDASILRTDDHVISEGDSSELTDPLINVTMKLNPQFEGTFVASAKDNTFNISRDVFGEIEPGGGGGGNMTILNPLNETYNCDPEVKDTTFTKKDEPEKKKMTPEQEEEEEEGEIWRYQSTPMKTSSVKKQNQRRINLSPIKCDSTISGNLSKEGNFEKYLQEATNQAFTPEKLLKKSPFQSPEKQEEDEEEEVVERRRLPIPIHMLRDDERQSLKNFEEYEKTLLMQDNNNDFDDVLNRFATMDISRQTNEKMRQSLDNIKKRHSLVNLEKQQQLLDQTLPIDSNKLSESLNKSRRLLNRRSRLYDDLEEPPPPPAPAPAPPAESQPAPAVEKVVSPTKGNRDRFKTIRIFRPPEENPPSLPDAGDTTVVVEEEFKKPTIPVRNIPKPRYFKSALAKPISQQKFNSADDLLDSQQESQEHQQRSTTQQTLKSPMGFKSKSIHNLLSGQRSLLATAGDYKSSNEALNKTLPQSKLSLAPSSRYGKSNQSLDRLTSASSRQQHQNEKPETRNYQSNLAAATTTMRNNPKRLGLVRPSSGYYSYSVKRNDSDTESGRYSPQSLSSSSASSKGSINVPAESSSASSIQDTTITFDSHKTYSSLQPPPPPPAAEKRAGSNSSASSKVPRPTGLRLPSNFRAPSALPRATGIPRR